MVEVKKRERESIASLLRRFTRKVQQSGILIRARRIRYRELPRTRREKRESARRREEIRKEKEKLRKLGKLEDERFGPFRGRRSF